MAFNAIVGCTLASLVPLQQRSVHRMTPAQMEYFKTIDYGLSQVRDQPLDRFQSIPTEGLPERVVRQSNYFLRACLREDALPADADMSARFFLADARPDYDLIEYFWEYESQEFRLVQSINAMKLEIQIKGALDEPGQLKSVVSKVVRLQGVDSSGNDYKVDLSWPIKLQDGVRFSSNPNQPINTMGYWYHRLDVAIEDSTLALVFYNRIPQRVGFREGFGWIQEEMDATPSKQR